MENFLKGFFFGVITMSFLFGLWFAHELDNVKQKAVDDTITALNYEANEKILQIKFESGLDTMSADDRLQWIEVRAREYWKRHYPDSVRFGDGQ